jgi:hypothetical protein
MTRIDYYSLWMIHIMTTGMYRGFEQDERVRYMIQHIKERGFL